MSRLEIFEEELNFIRDESLRKFAEYALENVVPDYFFTVAASSTDKYHPEYALGTGGLVRHTKAGMRIIILLSRLDWWHITEEELDLILVSALLHDTFKHGWNYSEYTVFDHPNIAPAAFSKDKDLVKMITDEQMKIIKGMILSHMGQWNTNKYARGIILNVPVTKLEKFLHLADYMASRRCLEMNFDTPIKR